MFFTGQELRWARRNAGITQATLAAAAGTTASYVAALERMDELPFKIRERLATALRIYYPTSPLPSEIVTRPAGAPPATATGRNYTRLTPDERARNSVQQRSTTIRLKAVAARNRLRDIARPRVEFMCGALIEIAAKQDGDAYHNALAEAAATAENKYVEEFIAAAQTRVVPADDPLVTLPLEPLE